MKTIAFFNNEGGVGKTSLVYHLAWMYADLGLSVLAVDLDPQANLTSMFVDDERLELLWPEHDHSMTIYGAVQPLLDGTGDIATPHVESVSERIGLIVGDLALSASEDELSSQWPRCLDRHPRAFRVLSAFWRVMERAAQERNVRVILIDVGPNLGAIIRAAMITAAHVVIPLAGDLYSLQGLRSLGPALRHWRTEWQERRSHNPIAGLSIPTGEMEPAGYVVLQHAVRMDRPVKAHNRWMNRIPYTYGTYVLGQPTSAVASDVSGDPSCLATLRHYRSLMPLAQEAHKPMFYLKPADGAIGGHARAVQECYKDFRALALALANRCDIELATRAAS